MSEFSLISDYFLPLTYDAQEASRLQDDVALLRIPEGYEMAVSTDSLYEGVHFFKGTAPDIIAKKALRSNISDLYASGAVPYCYQLSVGFESAPEKGWIECFTDALLQDQSLYGLFCSGGDTSSLRAGGLAITMTVMGLVPAGKSWRRSCAKDSDVLIATGVFGAGYQGFLDHKTIVPDYPALSTDCLQSLHSFVHAAVDVSDGALADAAHIARSSGLDVILRKDDAKIVQGLDWQQALTGGDDYLLLLCAAHDKAQECLDILKGQGCVDAHILGYVAAAKDIKNPQVLISDAAGQYISVPDRSGWDHF